MRYPVTVPRGVACASPRWVPPLNPMVPCEDRRQARIAADVMTGDPEPVACGDSLVEVAGRMRSLLVAFLPVCDQNGDLHGISAYAMCTAPCAVGTLPDHGGLARAGTAGDDRRG